MDLRKPERLGVRSIEFSAANSMVKVICDLVDGDDEVIEELSPHEGHVIEFPVMPEGQGEKDIKDRLFTAVRELVFVTEEILHMRPVTPKDKEK